MALCDFSTPIPCGVNQSFVYTRYPCDHDDPRPQDTRGLPVIVDLQTPIRSEVINRHRESILAIEGELGIQPSGTYTTVRDRLDAFEYFLCSGSGNPNVLEDGYDVVTHATDINFYGPGVQVYNHGNGQADVFISGAGSSLQCFDGYVPIQITFPIATNGQTNFTIPGTAPYNDIVFLFIDRVKQTNYSVSGNTITWTGPSLLTSDTIEIFYYIYNEVDLGTVYQPISQTFPSASGNPTYTLSGIANNNTLMLFIGGLKQEISDYIVVGSSVIWNGAPLITSDLVEATYTISGTPGFVYEPITQLFTATLGQILFPLTITPSDPEGVLVFVSGIKQQNDVDYHISGNYIVWDNSVILNGSDTLEAVYFNPHSIYCFDTSNLYVYHNGVLIDDAVTKIDFVGDNFNVTSLGYGLVTVQVDGYHSSPISDVSLTLDGYDDVRVEVLSGMGISKVYLARLEGRVTMWISSTQIGGNIDIEADLRITTDGYGVITCTVAEVFPSIIPAVLTGAAATIISSTSGFTIQAQRIPSTTCTVRSKWKIQNFEDIS